MKYSLVVVFLSLIRDSCGTLEDDLFLKNYITFEGDILMGKDSGIAGMDNSALSKAEARWPDGTVPFKISTSFTGPERQKILDAMGEIMERTCVTFRTVTSDDADGIYFVKPSWKICTSYVGRQRGEQPIALASGCLDRSVILHELMHALGFVHEHTRSDRDRYVEILWDNILDDPKIQENFYKRKGDELALLDTPYAFDSILHYKLDEFSKNGKHTIRPLHPVNHVGGGEKLSEVDIVRINKLYCCGKGEPAAERAAAPKIQWKEGGSGMYWSNGCEFIGYDIDKVHLRADQCGDECARNSKCTHITWTPYEDGTCYLKAGVPAGKQPTKAEQAKVCGFRTKGPEWKVGGFGAWWAMGCEFGGNDIQSLNVEAALCGDSCYFNKRCTHFTWSPADGGTCTLKDGIPRDAKPNCANNFFVCGHRLQNFLGGPIRCI